MGKVMSVISRKVNRFNVENRAYKILEKEKPTAAPTYNTAVKDRQRTLEVDPDYIERESRRDINLNERLKQVFVTSKDTYYGTEEQRVADDKPLPLDRAVVEDYEFGFKEPEKVSRGKCTLRQAMKFISDNQGDPATWTPERIAEDYKIKRVVVDNILEHFRSFQIYLPNKDSKDKILAQNSQDLLGKGAPQT